MILEYHILVRILVAVPLFTNHRIIQGHLDNPEVVESYKNYHPLLDLYIRSARGQITSFKLGENI